MINQRVDDWGRVVFTEDGLLELFYKGLGNASELLCEDTPELATYNHWCKVFDHLDRQIDVYQPIETPPDAFHAERQSEWIIPSEYQDINVEQWLIAKCVTDEQIERVSIELALFKKHNMYGVLRLFIYIVDQLTEKGVWWGVGRGSSVASYCLFLIGVHRIDSLKYNLDIKEFIRDS